MTEKKLLWACALITVLLAGCSSAPPYLGPDAEVTYKEIVVSNERYQDSSIRIYPDSYPAGAGFKITSSNARHFNYNSGVLNVYIGLGGYLMFNDANLNELYPLFSVRFNNSQSPKAVYLSVHPKDPANPEGEKYWRLDRIDGLLAVEDALPIIERRQEAEAARIAQNVAQEEERQRAREEANRNFFLVPNYFQQADYTRSDLFEAVAASERLQVTELVAGHYITPSRRFVSDVVFVSQNGTDITFRTSDNAISKRMKVDSRTGLTAGQRVRIYYTVFRVEDWRVAAIERL